MHDVRLVRLNLGGYNTLAAGSSVQKEFTNLYAHNSVTVDLDFVKIDSWDNELFYVYADDVLVYTSDTISKVRARRYAEAPRTTGTNSSTL